MTIRRSCGDGPHGQIHLRRTGEGAPLLLLHQSPLSGGQFSAVMISSTSSRKPGWLRQQIYRTPL